MPRPVKIRRVETLPSVRYFKPAGIPMRLLEEIRLSVEEVEAVRLRDIEKLEQEKCAERMRISRATFQRILTAAREKIAEALLNGKSIRIEGGSFEMANRKHKCANGHEWTISFDEIENISSLSCPKCEKEKQVSTTINE